MRKTTRILIFVAIVIAMLCMVTACQNKNIYLNINGDIEDNYNNINLSELDKVAFQYTDNEEKTVKEKGYTLQAILENVTPIFDDNYILITATDGVSTMIEYSNLDKLIIYENEENKLCVNAPEFPRSVGIKDIADITIIAKNNGNWGIKLVGEGTQYISYGNAKLLFYTQEAVNKMNDIIAYKYVPKEKDISLRDMLDCQNLIAYFTDFDIARSYDNTIIEYKNGNIVMPKSNGQEGILFGIVSDVSTLSYDSFDIMKNALNNDKKVVFILPDGYSYQQYELYKNQLNILGRPCIKAATVNPAISNVSLASLITGKSPFYTEITSRPVKEPAVTDIFEIAKSKGKTVSYIEGSKNLLITSEEPILSLPDSDGFTDSTVFKNSVIELDKNKDLTFIHFHGIDDVNHEYGALSTQALAKLVETDNYISTLLTDFHGVVVIVPDHGHIDKVDSEGNHYGEHGLFQNEDMYIPYFTWEQ